MKKLLLLLGSCITLAFSAQAAPPKPKPQPAAVDSVARYQATVDSINNSFHYQQGYVVVLGGVGELTVPKSFRYLRFGPSRRT